MPDSILTVLFNNAANVLVAIVGFFLVRTLRQLDEGVRELRKDHADLRREQELDRTRVARLEGFNDGLMAQRPGAP